MINLNTSNVHGFILVAVDYFTKWLEAVSFAKLKKVQLTRFI